MKMSTRGKYVPAHSPKSVRKESCWFCAAVESWNCLHYNCLYQTFHLPLLGESVRSVWKRITSTRVLCHQGLLVFRFQVYTRLSVLVWRFFIITVAWKAEVWSCKHLLGLDLGRITRLDLKQTQMEISTWCNSWRLFMSAYLYLSLFLTLKYIALCGCASSVFSIRKLCFRFYSSFVIWPDILPAA